MKPFCHECLSSHIRSYRTDAHAPVSLTTSDNAAIVGMTYADLVLLEQIYRTPEGNTEIYEAMVAGSTKHYVAKVQYCRDAAELNARQEEAALQRSIRHPNISRCLTSFLDPNHLVGFKHILVLEHGGKGSLHDLIRRRNRDQSPWPEEQLCESIVNLLDAFTYLQSINVVHRDIKPQNIIVMENESLKVIDFGLSLEGQDLLRTQDYPVMGTVLYLCPMVKKAYLDMWDGRNTTGTVVHSPFKSDVYSLGLTLFHMASLRPPTDLNNLDAGEDALQRSVNTAIAALDYGEWVKMALRKMLIVREDARPDFIQLKDMIYTDGMFSYIFEDDASAEAENGSVIEPESEVSPPESLAKAPPEEPVVVRETAESKLMTILRGNRSSLSVSVQALVQKTLSPEPPSLIIVTFTVKPLEVEAICLCIDHVTKLEKLEFIGAKLANEHFVTLAAHSFQEISIDEFSLGSNILEPQGVARLAEFLPKCSNLRILRMWENHLGLDGTRHLCTALKRLPSLQELFLGSNDIGDQGVKVLAQCLQHMPALLILSLVSNKISDTGVDYLAEQLRYAASLTKLFLDSNDIGPQGAQYLCAAIIGLQKLSVVRLMGTRLKDDALAQFKQVNPRLRVSV